MTSLSLRLKARLVALGVVLTALSPDYLPAFEINDFTTWQFAPSASATLTAESAAINLLPRLIGSHDAFANELGFIGASDFTHGVPPPITVSNPYPVFVIKLDRLITFYQTSQNPIWLLLEKDNFLRWPIPFPSRFLYPIKKGNQVRSSVLIAMSASDHRWRIHRIGSPLKIKTLAGTANAPIPTYFVVEIPALDRVYLGTISGTNFRIKYVKSEPFHNIIHLAGEEVPASVVFSELQQEVIEVFQKQVPR